MQKIMVENCKILSLVCLLAIFTLNSCREKDYEDHILSYKELPIEVKEKFDEIFDYKASNETFIITTSTDEEMECHHEMISKLNLTADIDLYFGETEITVPSELTAVRIFVYHLNHIYYIKRAGFSKLDGANLDYFLDYKEQKYSVYEIKD